tara:strand:+ start:5847 stop:9725 length:3879 start_codon:yes stop_codon:yes gene_type:complete
MNTNNNKEIQKTNMYDVTSYSDKELLDVLDLTNPSDRELEAKLIFLINKYRNNQNESGDELVRFFEDIYTHFFETSDDDIEEYENITDDIDEAEEEEEEVIEVPTNTDIMKKLNNEKYLDPSKSRMDNVMNYTKDLEYAKGQLNPLLQQTVERTVTIDSQYRQDKRSPPTDFTLNLSEPLKDVVSMKLYSVEIPYVWWTINSSFGSNFFILKGNAPGIDNGNHDYQVEISPGNYSPSELSESINENITKMKNIYTDVDFGATEMQYNKYSSLITMNTEIYKQYNETSYYLNFPGWTTPEPPNDINYYINRSKSIPGFLGFTDISYNFISVDGNNSLPLTADIDSFRYKITSENNSFIVEKFIRVPNSTAEIIDLTITVTLSLTMGLAYTRSAIYTNLNKVIRENQYLSDESNIERIDKETNSYFKLSIKPNRFTTNNVANSKIRIRFPTENINEATPQFIWTGNSSCFKFINKEFVLNDIYSEVSPLVQQTDQFSVTTSPYIYLKNIEPGYDVSINDYRIDIPNSDISYNVNTYIKEINNRIIDASMGEILSSSNSYLDDEGRFYMKFDILRTITTGKYKVDFTNTIFNTVMGLNEIYELNEGINVINTSFVYQNSYIMPSTKLLLVTAKNDDNFVGSDLAYTLYSSNASGVIGSGEVFKEINNLFDNFQDTNNEYIFAGSSLDITVSEDNNTIYASLKLNINKQLTEETYSVQFLEDISYSITNPIFQLEQGDSVDIGGETLPYVKYDSETDIVSLVTDEEDLNIGILRNNGLLGSDTLTAITDDVMEYTLDIQNATSYVIDSNYLMYISVGPQDAINPDYGRSDLYNSPVPYGYLIPSPSESSYSNLADLQLAINVEFGRFSDLAGSNIELIDNNDGTAKVKLSLVIRQKYFFDSWNKHVNIDHAMIDNTFPLLNSSIPSVYDVNRQFTDLSFSSVDNEGTTLLGIKSNSYILQNLITLNESTNKIELITYEEGVLADENNIIIELPIKSGNEDIRYTRDMLLTAINNLFVDTVASESSIGVTTIEGTEFISINITINKEYRAKDYRISFFDPYSFVKCYIGVSSVRSTTWDSTLGWILGYREFTVYDLSNYESVDGSSIISLTADTGISTELFNYFMLCIDDYNQSHLNDGLVTITTRDTEVPLPSYATRTNFICDPATGKKVYNTETRTDYNKLTEKQVQSLVSKANTSASEINATTGNVSSKIYGATPFASDVFGVIPLKLSGRNNGETIVEFGGTLQNQQRKYFGPVNIQRMSVKLVSDRGNVVDFNNANWSFSIICEQLYKPQPR